MTAHLRTIALVFTVALALGVSACGGDDDDVATATTVTTSAPADSGDAFCALNAQIDAETASIQSQEDAAVAFKRVLPIMDQALEQAPDEIRNDVEQLAGAAHDAVDSGDFSAFEDGSLAAAETAVGDYCA